MEWKVLLRVHDPATIVFRCEARNRDAAVGQALEEYPMADVVKVQPVKKGK